MSAIEMLKPGAKCSTCGHDSGEHTRLVGLIPRWCMYTYGCSRCDCGAMTDPPETNTPARGSGERGEA